MKIRWTGGPATGAQGVLIVEHGKAFRAIGPGGIAEVSDERAKCLVTLNLASLDLRENLDELTALEPEELVDPDMLKRTGEMYTRCHEGVLEFQKRARAARAAVAKMEAEG